MKQYITTYRAYRELIEKLRDEPFLKSLIRSYGTKAQRKDDVFRGRVSQREIDTDWLVAIEGGLRYIDQAIRENRRFIVTQEEIVPIERARKITSESVRHLAQHTSLISKVENGYVTPEKILNVEKEETVAVYENRFLRTLITELMRFVDRIIENIGMTDDYVKYSVSLSRKFKSLSDKINLKFEYEYEQLMPSEMEAVLLENVEDKSDIERVFRVKKILVDFAGTPLMKALHGTEPVRPPIIQTNVMKQNVSFKKSFELYTFIMSYRKPGYKVIVNSDDEIFSKDTNTALSTMFYLTDFVLAIGANEIMENRMRRSYEEELRTEAKLEAYRRQKEIDEWNEKIDEAVRKTRDAYEVRIEALTGELTRYKDLYEEYYANHTALLAEHEQLKRKYAEQETKFYDELEMVKTDYDAQIAELQRVHTEETLEKDRLLAERTEQFERELTQERLYTAQKIEELNADKEEALLMQAEEHKADIAKMQELRSQELQKEKEYWESRLSAAEAAHEKAIDDYEATNREHLMRIFNTLLYARGFSSLVTEDRLGDLDSVEKVFSERRDEIEQKAAQDADIGATERERERYDLRLRNFDDEYARIINGYRDRLKALGDSTENTARVGYIPSSSPFFRRPGKRADRRYEKPDKAVAQAMRAAVMETRPFTSEGKEPQGLVILTDSDGGLTGKEPNAFDTRLLPVLGADTAKEFFDVLSGAVKENKFVIYVGSSGKIRPACDVVAKYADELRLRNLAVLDTGGLIGGVSVVLSKFTAMLEAGIPVADAFELIETVKKSVITVGLGGINAADFGAKHRVIKYNGYDNSCDALLEMVNGVPEIRAQIHGGFDERLNAFFTSFGARLKQKTSNVAVVWTNGLSTEEISQIKHALVYDYGFRTVRLLENYKSPVSEFFGSGAFGITFMAGEREADKFVRSVARRPVRVEAETKPELTVCADARLLPESKDGIASLPPIIELFAGINILRKSLAGCVKEGGDALLLVPSVSAELATRVAEVFTKAFDVSLTVVPVADYLGSAYVALGAVGRMVAEGGDDLAARLASAVNGMSALAVVGGKPNRAARVALENAGVVYNGGTVIAGTVDGRKKYRKFKDFDENTVALAIGNLLGGVENCEIAVVGSRFGDALPRIMTELEGLEGGNTVVELPIKQTPDLGKTVAAVHILPLSVDK